MNSEKTKLGYFGNIENTCQAASLPGGIHLAGTRYLPLGERKRRTICNKMLGKMKRNTTRKKDKEIKGKNTRKYKRKIKIQGN